jgi:3'-phosphoadenosine 5'-phosphosulfate sulfotransferase (PAPS reductase)/FAD synthetase
MADAFQLRMIVTSISGGKDSTATALLARQEDADAHRYVFADTGNEHELTLEYIERYLRPRFGPIDVVRADFSKQIEGKRRFIAEKWEARGVPREAVDRALAALQPTGVPFLDLCLWKGRFPSRMAQFCTQELKRYPLDAFMLERLAEGFAVESWQGVRRDESRNRKDALAEERTPEGWLIRRPIVEWSADRVVRFILEAGLELNPLYSQGMTRVGCMPCINCRKDELSEIAARFPQHIDRIREWERLVSEASKRGWTTFFTDGTIDIGTGEYREGVDEDGEPARVEITRAESDEEIFGRLNIDARISWARTTRGGKQFDLLKTGEPSACSSAYGLCE